MSCRPSTVPVELARPAPSLTREQQHWSGKFTAMACPCEVLIEHTIEADARTIVDAVARSAWRIEQKFSRYRDDNIVHLINTSQGRPVLVDEETARLLDFGNTLTSLSEGRFDLTSGVLRKAWTFDGSNRVPSQQQIETLLGHVGWSKVKWDRAALQLQLQAGMQIDFGGIGKEYAVDNATRLAQSLAPGLSCLVNLGGDVAVLNPRKDGLPWSVGIESTERPGTEQCIVPLLQVVRRPAAIAAVTFWTMVVGILTFLDARERLARARCAPLDHGRARNCFSSWHARDPCHAARRPRGAVVAGRRHEVLDPVVEFELPDYCFFMRSSRLNRHRSMRRSVPREPTIPAWASAAAPAPRRYP